MKTTYPWTYPAITPGILWPLATAIALSIAVRGSVQEEMAERFHYDVYDLACSGSTQYDCAHSLILAEVLDAQTFHDLCISYGVYHHDMESEICVVNWSDDPRADQEKARLDAEEYTAERWEYIDTWNSIKRHLNT